VADLTIDILTNKEKYPDAMEITLADGQKITVKQYRDALQPRAEFTRASEAWSKEKKDLEGAVQGLQGQLAQALEEAKKRGEPVKPAPGSDGKLTEDDLLADPILGPIVTRLKGATERLEAHETRLKQHEDTWLQTKYLGEITQIEKAHNTAFNADGKGKAFDRKGFLDYVLERRITDLDSAYRA